MTTATRTRIVPSASRRRARKAGLLRIGLGVLAAFGLLLALLGPAGAAAPPGGHGDPSAHFNWTDLGYKDKDVTGGPLEPGDEPMSPPFMFMLINFGIVLVILGWAVMPRLQRFLGARHQTIKEALEESARLREDARAKLDEYTERAKAAEREVDEMLAAIRADAEAEKQRILADAEAQAAALARDAENRIAAEIDRARAQLEREVVAVAVAVAEKLIRDKATSEDQVALVNTFIADVREQARTSAGEQA
jgi:F-type H+-transporting ATPase subunit b